MTKLALIAILFVSATQFAVADDAPMPTLDELLTTFRSEFVAIHPGEEGFPAEFTLGGGGNVGAPFVVNVTFERPFEMGKYEIPQNLYEAVMGENPSAWKGVRNSTEMMTWSDAQDFCTQVTTLLLERNLIEEGQVVRLPTEAEWEYCCRAGTDTVYSFGDEARAPGDDENKATVLDDYGWHTGNAAGNDPAVGALVPNPWGLYDMHGYLSEFCQDDWHASHAAQPADGSAWTSGQAEPARQIVIKGGSWRDWYYDLTSRSRQPFDRACGTSDAVGFRCVIQ